jgi:hypothetical protein
MGWRLNTGYERGDKGGWSKMRNRKLYAVFTSSRSLVIRVNKSRRVRWTSHKRMGEGNVMRTE